MVHGGKNQSTNTPGPGSANRFSVLDQNSTERPTHEDISSPFYLSSGDNPGLVLVTQVLDGNNYNSWRRAMTTSLTAKNKMFFVDGSIARPEQTDSVYNSWIHCNSMVISWIMNSVSREIAESLLYIDDASEIWRDLYECFHQANGPRIFQLKQKLINVLQGSSDVTSYFTKLKTIWDELKDFRPVTTCTCGAMKSLVDFQQQEHVLQFLMGLNESFSQIRAQILLMDPMPSINKVFSLVIQEERQRSIGAAVIPSTINSDSGAAIYVNKGGSSSSSNFANSKGKRERPYCTHCGGLGHVIDKCYKLHGYSRGYKQKGKNSYQRPAVNHTSAGEESHGDVGEIASSGSGCNGLGNFFVGQCQQPIAMLSAQLQQSTQANEPQMHLVSNFSEMGDQGHRRWEDYSQTSWGGESLFLDVPFVCKSWHRATLDPSCWEYLVFPDNWRSFADRLSARGICQSVGFSINRFVKFILNRSWKKATTLYIIGGCLPETLKYAVDESPALRVLRLSVCQLFDHKLNFMEVFGKCKSLEDTEIDCSYGLLDILTAIRLNCKNLNSLRVYRAKIYREEALVIVDLLPNIKHLYLRKAWIERENLVTILKGNCEQLLTLDVSDCQSYDVDEEILELASRIHTFKFQGSRRLFNT